MSMSIKEGQVIQVLVEAQTDDIIIVSWSCHNNHDNDNDHDHDQDHTIFRGALLATHKKLPPGVDILHPCLRPIEQDEKLYSVSKRYDYQFPGIQENSNPIGRLGHKKRTKMTVRLRPRKVLCSNCRSICNENEENVTKDRDKARGEDRNKDRDRDNHRNGPRNKRVYLSSARNKREGSAEESKVTRAKQTEGESYARNEVWLENDDKIVSRLETDESGIDKSKVEDGGERYDKSDTRYSSSERNSENRFTSSDKRDVLDVETKGKKPKNKSVPKSDEEVAQKKRRTDNATPPVGEDAAGLSYSSARTLKISFGEGEETVLKLPVVLEETEPSVESETKNDTKAVKRALKKAKRQAKKRGSSPAAESPPTEDSSQSFPKRHRHKVKHKKKHKDGRKTKSVDGQSDSDIPSCEENYSAMKERCLKQKLSINLKRLNDDNYEKNEELDLLDESSSSETELENWDENVSSGMNIVPGDIVWGKLQGFSWWPGRVLDLRCGGQAHVAWYASSTSSMMPQNRLNPFLDSFKIRFNKKKKGSYKEAVRLASLEARSVDPLAADPLATPANNITPLSPPPIDVLS